MPLTLNPDEARIFRIMHRDNLAWIMDHGLHASNGQIRDPNFRNIGNLDLIGKRSGRVVTVGPGGTLSDYVPFYFTPFSIMMYNIHTGYNVPRVPNEEIVILVSSLRSAALRPQPNPLVDGRVRQMNRSLQQKSHRRARKGARRKKVTLHSFFRHDVFAQRHPEESHGAFCEAAQGPPHRKHSRV